MNYYDFVSKIKCTNWWILMYNFFSRYSMHESSTWLFWLLYVFGYKYPFWLSHFSHHSLFTIHIIESLLWTSIFSLCYNVNFLHISLINVHDPCIVTTYLISLIYVRETRVLVIHIIESLFWLCFSFFNKYNVVFLLRYKVVLLNIL